MKMNFCVGHGAEPDVPLLVDVAKTAEKNGFAYMTLLDSPTKTLDVHFMTTIAAQNTKKIKLGQGVVDPMTYHPITIASAMGSIDEMSGGRAFIGIGTGLPQAKGRPAAKLKDMREAVKFIRGYMRGEEVEYGGAKMQSRWLKRPVPIYMSAHGPKALEVAGEIADGIIFLCINPVYVKWQLERVAVGAERAGRDPTKLDTWARCMVYVSPNKRDARRETSAYPISYAGLWRVLTKDSPEAADLRRRMEKAEPGIVESIAKASRAYADVVDPKQGEKLDAPHSKVVTDKLIDFFHFRGKEDDIIEHMNKLSEVGVKTISMTTYTLIDKVGMLKEVGSKIIPHFRPNPMPEAFKTK